MTFNYQNIDKVAITFFSNSITFPFNVNPFTFKPFQITTPIQAVLLSLELAE